MIEELNDRSDSLAEHYTSEQEVPHIPRDKGEKSSREIALQQAHKELEKKYGKETYDKFEKWLNKDITPFG